MITRVYRYGLLPPAQNATRVADQIAAGHRYYNTLIEIERQRRGEVHAAQSEWSEIEGVEAWRSALVDDLATARAAIKAQRANTRSRSDTAEQRERATEYLAALREVSALLREEKIALRDNAELLEKYDAISERANDRVKAARSTCGAYWGTYLLAEQAADAARKDAIVEPRFRRWTGDGAVGVQLQGGCPVERVLSCVDSRLQIDETPTSCGAGKPRPRVRMRVGSDVRDPIWAEWPLILHRPLPPGTVIAWATVHRERLAGKDRWSLHLTLEMPAPGPRTGDAHDPGLAVAVDIGWRRRPDGGLRVAYTTDAGEICVEPAVLARLRKGADLRSIRDRRMDAIRQELAAWRREHIDGLPEWLRDATATLHKWRSPARFAALALRWRAAPVSEHESVRELLEAWRKKDKHLWTWEVNLRDKVLRRRREQYRVLAADLARHYRTLVIERFDLRAMQARVAPESGEDDRDAAHSQQQIAATSILRDCLKAAFAARGGVVVELPAAHTTHDCAACGSREVWDQADELLHRCAACGTTWDQDENAAKNMLKAWREHPGGAPLPVGARVTDHGARVGDSAPRQAKWAKRGRHKMDRSQTGADGAEITA